MNRAKEDQSEAFERVLHTMSADAFRVIVAHGVRDMSTLLSFDPAAVAARSPGIASEILSIQQSLQQDGPAEGWADDRKPASAGAPEGLKTPESAVSNVQTIEDDDGGEFFSMLLSCISTRSARVLIGNGISTCAGFLSVTPEQLARYPMCGDMVIGEVMNLLGLVRRTLILVTANGEPSTTSVLTRYFHYFASNARVATPPTREIDHAHEDRPKQVSRLLDRRPHPTPCVSNAQHTASWSILRRPLRELYELDASGDEMLWVIASELNVGSVLSLPDADWKDLANRAIFEDDSAEVLLALTLDYLFELDLKPQVFDALVRSMCVLVTQVHCDCSPQIQLSEQPILTESDVLPIRNFRMDSFNVPQGLLDRLKAKGQVTWGDLSVLTETDILAACGVSIEGLRQVKDLWRMRLLAQQAREQVSGFPMECFASFDSMVQEFVNLVAVRPRERTVLLGHVGILEDRRWTLEDLGNLLGLTRERVRQIKNKRMKLLLSPTKLAVLSRFWMAVDEILRVGGGTCLLRELAKQLMVKLEWQSIPSIRPLSWLLGLPGTYVIDRGAEIVSDAHHKCFNCESALRRLEEVFADHDGEKCIEDVVASLLISCQSIKCDSFAPSLHFSEGFVCSIAVKTDTLVVEDGVVYSSDTWAVGRGSRVQMVEQIAKDAAKPLHFVEVYEQAKRLLPDDPGITERNIYGWIGRSAKLVLWDRGTYTHCDFIKVPRSLIMNVERWLRAKLQKDIPFVSVAGAYSAFEEQLLAAGVPSASALYSCLRQSRNLALSYPRYPYALLPGQERLPITIALEQSISEAGGLVRLSDIRAYAVDQLGISEQMFGMHMYNVPNVIRAGKGAYVHLDNISISHDRLAAIVAYAADLVSVAGHVSVKRLFKDKEVSCLSMGVESAEMLYALLQVYGRESIYTPHYPQILAHSREAANITSRGVVGEVVDLIAELRRPCSYDELEQRFVDELGYGAQTVYSINTRDKILPYTRGSVVHFDTIGWSDAKQNQLEEKALDELMKAREAGRCYARTSDLLEYHEMPDLETGIPWMFPLLAELLVRGGQFRVIGNARNAFVAERNDEGIQSLEDLIYHLLKSNYDGASDLESLGRDLREAGIVQKHITAAMLGKQRKVSIEGHIIMLRELRGRA